MASRAAEGLSRIAGPDWGRHIDRQRPVALTFDRRLFSGFAGDTIASALYAGGQVMLSRSFKYHRPRGVLTMAGHDANTLVQVGDEPNVRADLMGVTDGIAVRSVNRLGSLQRDLLAGIGLVSRFLPVGFYYRSFFRPQGAWRFWERVFRHGAGLGWLEPAAPHRYSDKVHLFADVLVAGAGPAGLAAAIAAAETGAETLLIDEGREPGGSLLYGRGGATRDATQQRLATLVARAQALPNLRILGETTVSGLFADNWVSAIAAGRLTKIRALEVVVATGAFGQPLVFANNDRPGIIFADAAQRLMRLYGVRPGKRGVVVTANQLGYEAALDLLDAGIEVAAIVDLGTARGGAAVEACRARGVRIVEQATIVNARGRHRVRSVALARIRGEGEAAPAHEWIDCDHALISVGMSPALNLACHAGARALYDPDIAMHRAVDVPAGVRLVGAAAGYWTAATLDTHAADAGRSAAAQALGNPTAASAVPNDPAARSITHGYPVFAGAADKDFIDFDEDLKTADIENSVRDGYDDIQLVKRYSTVGLGPSQGRHSNLTAIRVVARATGQSAAAIGTTTYRPPLVPEKFAVLAGRARDPSRRTPMHERHLAAGAHMMPAGLWMRPAHYAGKGDAAGAIAAEVRAVREGVGMIDVSTLGGFDIRGPEAAGFLERIYTGAYAKQPVGRARYALMTDETGVVIDDGVAARLAETHFYVTATTGAVEQVHRHMTRMNAEWRLDIDIANVTSAYAGINVAGPKARTLLTAAGTDIVLDNGAFPYMGVREGTIAGIPIRALRVGFVGELGYEIHVPADLGEALWDALADAGRALGLKPFGVEAQRILRLEKGHIIVGQDTDGLTHPAEAGLDWALAKAKPFHVGKRAIEIQTGRGLKRRLVGFALVDPGAPAPKECHLVIRDGEIAGRVTSVARSQAVERTIGLAYVPPDLAATGSRFSIRIDGGRPVEAEVVPTPFYDPGNTRQEV